MGSEEGGVTKEEAVRMLLSAHYKLMDDPRYWYDAALKDASRILCVAASDLRKEILDENHEA